MKNNYYKKFPEEPAEDPALPRISQEIKKMRSGFDTGGRQLHEENNFIKAGSCCIQGPIFSPFIHQAILVRQALKNGSMPRPNKYYLPPCVLYKASIIEYGYTIINVDPPFNTEKIKAKPVF